MSGSHSKSGIAVKSIGLFQFGEKDKG